MIRQVARLLGGLLGRMPVRAALRAADLVAPLGRMLRARPDARVLQSLFPTLNANEAARMVRSMMSMEARNQALVAILRRGGRRRLSGLLLDDAGGDLPEPPTIYGTFHIGPLHVLGAALERTHEVLALWNRGNADEQQRTAAFYEASRHLRSGGVVLIALDPQYATRIDVPFLANTLQLARGAFRLACSTGTPLVPLVAHWKGEKIGVVAGPRLQSRDEGELAFAVAQWLEEYLRASPDQMSLRIYDLIKTRQSHPS